MSKNVGGFFKQVKLQGEKQLNYLMRVNWRREMMMDERLCSTRMHHTPVHAVSRSVHTIILIKIDVLLTAIPALGR